MVDSDRQAGAIEITEKMIEAGCYAAREYCLGLPLADLVERIYLAMRIEALDTDQPS
jgi:hypothetical protein